MDAVQQKKLYDFLQSQHNEGNMLRKRNELVTHVLNVPIPTEGNIPTITRFNDLNDYSAVVVGISLDEATLFDVMVEWGIKEVMNPAPYGDLVERKTIAVSESGKNYASGYLEIKGTQLTVRINNRGEEQVNANVYLLGIR